MIGHLKGVPFALTPESVLLDVGGVGYALAVSLATYYELQKAGSAPVSLWVHTHVREGEIALYGFWTAREQAVFEKLIAVSGIGPRLARAILSGLPLDELVAAVRRGEVSRLTRIPGVGRKTAERIVLELRDRFGELATGEAIATTGDEDADVVSALVNLGYKQQQAEQAVAEARRELGAVELHQLLRNSLQRLSRR